MSAHRTPSPRDGLLRRFAYLLTGLAIGCAAVGAFQIAQRHQAQRDAAARTSK